MKLVMNATTPPRRSAAKATRLTASSALDISSPDDKKQGGAYDHWRAEADRQREHSGENINEADRLAHFAASLTLERMARAFARDG